MYVLDNNEFAVLELLAMKPLSYFPPFPQMIATRLARRGLVIFKDGRWHPTAEGFSLIGRNGELPTPSARKSSGGAQSWRLPRLRRRRCSIAPPTTATSSRPVTTAGASRTGTEARPAQALRCSAPLHSSDLERGVLSLVEGVKIGRRSGSKFGAD